MPRKSFLHRSFGLELEFSTNQFIMEHMLREIPGFKFRNRNSESPSNGRDWELKPECSSESELVTPVITLDYMGELKKVLDHINKNHHHVTCEDGLHVHVDISEFWPERLYLAWMYLEPAILKLFPKYRVYNDYIQLYIPKLRKSWILAKYITRDSAADVEFHHSTMSLEYYDLRKTAEFRLHEGTTDIKAIRLWVTFIMYFLEYARTRNIVDILGKKPIIYTTQLSQELKLPYYLQEWIDYRRFKSGK